MGGIGNNSILFILAAIIPIIVLANPELEFCRIYQYWDPILLQCAVREGYFCRQRPQPDAIATTYDRFCGRFTTCNNLTKTCTCNPGYLRNGNGGKCVGEIGADCEESLDCSTTFVSGVKCIDRTCQIEPLPDKCVSTETVYDENVGKCIAKIEEHYNFKAVCTIWNSTEFQCGRDSKTSKCVYNHCRCEDGYLPSGDKLMCVEGKEYGETCDAGDNPCDKKYECSTEGTCTCRGDGIWNDSDSLCYSDEYCRERHFGTYDKTSGSCKCLISRNCNLLSLNNESSYCPFHSSIETSNQNEVKKSRCECQDGYTANLPRTQCLIAKALGEACDDASLCDARSSTTCIDGTCNCNETTQIWDTFEKKCETKVGQQCSSGLGIECTRNAFCSVSISTCVCNAIGYSRSSEGRCLADYKSSCTSQRDCHAGFHCVGGVRNCAEMAGQSYDNGLVGCIGLVGSTCGISYWNNSARLCKSTMTCDSITETCQCTSGFVTIGDIRDKCFKINNYGQNCSNEECDFTKGLACIDGVCSCVDSKLTYLNNEVGCLAPIGYKCGEYMKLDSCTSRNSECNYYYSVQCGQHGICTNVGDTGNPQFVCKSDFNGAGFDDPGPNILHTFQ